MVTNNRTKYPTNVDNKDPHKTPILTPSIYCVFSINARFPINKLIVNPIPVKIPTPYNLIQLELLFDDSFAAKINSMPLTPSSIVGNIIGCFIL